MIMLVSALIRYFTVPTDKRSHQLRARCKVGNWSSPLLVERVLRLGATPVSKQFVIDSVTQELICAGNDVVLGFPGSL